MHGAEDLARSYRIQGALLFCSCFLAQGSKSERERDSGAVCPNFFLFFKPNSSNPHRQATVLPIPWTDRFLHSFYAILRFG